MRRLLVVVFALVPSLGGCGVQADLDRGHHDGRSAAPADSVATGSARGTVGEDGEETSAMDGQCRTEVIELHQFFEDWFTAKLDATDESFRRFDGVLADGFEIISPEGRKLGRDEILTALRGAHGMHPAGEFRIWIENVATRELGGGLHLTTYEEWQSVGRQTRGRLSTVVFRAQEGAPNGLEWIHVHEVWLGDS